MQNLTLMSNSGIQMETFSIEIPESDRFSMLFLESFNSEKSYYTLDNIYEIPDGSDGFHYYKKYDLYSLGFLAETQEDLSYDLVRAEDDVQELELTDEQKALGVFKMSFASSECKVASFMNQWLPMPYFKVKIKNKYVTRYDCAPLNWARFKMVPVECDREGFKKYNVLLAFDTRSKTADDGYGEAPVFEESYVQDQLYSLCSDEYMLMDYCSCSNEKTSEFVDRYLLSLAHPGVSSAGALRREKHKLAYLASYLLLINYLASKDLFPAVTLCRSDNVEVKDIDMFVDIGNSKTTALLVEDHSNFNQVIPLSLVDYSNPLIPGDTPAIRHYDEPFDMRVTFRKADFGKCGAVDGSRQFVYPSLVRVGYEANRLIHQCAESTFSSNSRSTYSSPKRYLWDKKMSDKEWKFLVLEGEEDNHIIDVPGVTNQIKTDGSYDKYGYGGGMHKYSRSSLMTFAFLEMLTQANVQINSHAYRTHRGEERLPRMIKRIVVTCPTTMSKVEREALVDSLKSAVNIYRGFYMGDDGSCVPLLSDRLQIVPSYQRSAQDDGPAWYYDEATCAQMVYMYSEIAHKYKGNCSEFFELYGKKEGDKSVLTVASLDMGAGTSDLMICKYQYEQQNGHTKVIPDPIFFDSFYKAGDDILHDLIRHIMFDGKDSVIYKQLVARGVASPQQKIKNFFGHYFNSESMAERVLKRDFNLQISVPLMSYWLHLLSSKSENRTVKYDEVFQGNEPSQHVLNHFQEHFGFDFRSIEWQFDSKKADTVVTNAIEPLLKQISAIMYAYACDVVVLSGRPSSIPAIGNVFLKYYPVSPNRLIILNDYNVGDWYPFSDNTDYIKNKKTVIAVGAMIAHYASELGLYSDFSLDTSRLAAKIKPTVNFVQSSRGEYCLSENAHSGKLIIHELPAYLSIKQIDTPSYPSRTLYKIDYNIASFRASAERKMLAEDVAVVDSAVAKNVNEECEALRQRLPLTLEISRDPDSDIENIQIDSITDSNEKNVERTALDIYIESLGANTDSYWLDNGTFEL